MNTVSVHNFLTADEKPGYRIRESHRLTFYEPYNSTYLRKYRNNHFLNSHSGTMFTCDVCGMTTNHKDTLMRHKRGHNKANQVTCDLCGKICHHRIALREVSTTLKQRRFLIDRAISLVDLSGWLPKRF